MDFPAAPTLGIGVPSPFCGLSLKCNQLLHALSSEREFCSPRRGRECQKRGGKSCQKVLGICVVAKDPNSDWICAGSPSPPPLRVRRSRVRASWARGRRVSGPRRGRGLVGGPVTHTPAPGRRGPEVSARRGWEEGGCVVGGRGAAPSRHPSRKRDRPLGPCLLLRVGLRRGAPSPCVVPHGHLFWFSRFLTSLAATGKVILVPRWPRVGGSGCPRPLRNQRRTNFRLCNFRGHAVKRDFFPPSPGVRKGLVLGLFEGKEKMCRPLQEPLFDIELGSPRSNGSSLWDVPERASSLPASGHQGHAGQFPTPSLGGSVHWLPRLERNRGRRSPDSPGRGRSLRPRNRRQ